MPPSSRSGPRSSVISTGSTARRPGDRETCCAQRSSTTSRASTTRSGSRSASATVLQPTSNQLPSLRNMCAGKRVNSTNRQWFISVGSPGMQSEAIPSALLGWVPYEWISKWLTLRHFGHHPGNARPRFPRSRVVGRTGLEPVTPCVSCKCATRLRQRPSVDTLPLAPSRPAEPSQSNESTWPAIGQLKSRSSIGSRPLSKKN